MSTLPPGRFIPRDRVHALADAVDVDPGAHRQAILRIRRKHARLMRYVDAAELGRDDVRDLCRYLVAVAVRVLESEGRLRAPSRHDLTAAEDRVRPLVGDVLPLRPGATDAARAVARAQPHLLDEALDALFEWPGASVADDAEKVCVYLVLWVVVEALDACWTPPARFVGDATYVRVHVPAPPVFPDPIPDSQEVSHVV
ncbi:MAG: hypothetical protein H6738_24660 [Alphaproteobacteria bacterium]|nr:hypothetical protein [Alphaproteobacteria bacterium]MCB9700003.1 hypothetical protein [Alphaproteobacteria bacterium]